MTVNSLYPCSLYSSPQNPKTPSSTVKQLIRGLSGLLVPHCTFQDLENKVPGFSGIPLSSVHQPLGVSILEELVVFALFLPDLKTSSQLFD